MFSIGHFIFGALAVGLGVLGVKFTYQLVGFTGRQQWIEKYTGQGSTYGVFKILSVLVIIGGVLFATGFGSDALNFLLSPLLKVFTPPTA